MGSPYTISMRRGGNSRSWERNTAPEVFLGVLFLFCLVPNPLRADDGLLPPATPTFTKDIAPIVFENCTSCHREGEAAPFPLESYRDVKKRGRLIRDVTASRYMPPWHAAPADVRYSGERGLTDREISKIRAWVEGGMPEGNPADLPSRPQFIQGWQLGEPDLVVQMAEPFEVPANGPDIYRNFVVPLNLREDRWVKGLEFRPRARSSSHHAILISDATGVAAKSDQRDPAYGFSGMSFLWMFGGKGLQRARAGGNLIEGLTGVYVERMRSGISTSWAVGKTPKFYTPGAAYRIPRSSDLVVQMHFHPSGKREIEQALIGLYFAESAPGRTLTHVEIPPLFGRTTGIDIPAGEKHYTIADSFTTPIDLDVYQLFPHAHYLGRQIKVTATDPDGSVRTSWIGGYVDFRRLFVFTLCSAFFVVRTKKNVLLQRRYSHPVDRSTGLRSDHTVILTPFNSAQAYPDPLRRVSYFDAETNKRLKFLTNNFTLPALTIAQIYKSRWQVELFFKWIKQHLRIKSFYGTSENAVKTQIWIAVSIYVLIAIVRKRLGLEASLYQNSTDSQRYAIRKNAPFTGTPAIRLPKLSCG